MTAPQILTAEAAVRGQASFAGALARRGLRAGDRVGLCVPSSGASLMAIGGALRSGVVPVVVNPQLTEPERAVIAEDADVQLWIDAPGELEQMTLGPGGELADVPLGRPMHYTSGTTGRPKGVYAGELTEAEARRLWDEEREQWGLDAGDVHLVCSPLQHSAPIRFALGTLLAGGSVLLPGPFDAHVITAAIGSASPTTTFCTPAHLQRLAAIGRLGALAALRLVAHAGSHCPERLKRDAIDAIGVDVLIEFYGSTEGQFTVCPSDEWLEHPGTVGRARPGRTIDVDAEGMVWCHVPTWARWTYWRDPARTEAAWRGDAFTVGDLGRLEGEYLFLSGRRNDLIISGGVNVYPAEVEHVLGAVAGVDEVVVFPRDDEQWGQRVCVAWTGTATAGDLVAEAAARLAPFKRPKEHHHVDAIPRVGLSKVRRDTMAEQLGLAAAP